MAIGASLLDNEPIKPSLQNKTVVFLQISFNVFMITFISLICKNPGILITKVTNLQNVLPLDPY